MSGWSIVIEIQVELSRENMHKSSLDKMQAFKDKYFHERHSEHLVIFDLGSQSIGGSYRQIFESPNWKYIGVDVEAAENVDIVINNPYEWEEIQSDSVDILISGQTLEHIEYFWLTMLEIARVLKPGGMCCLVAPSSGYEHRYPVDCWRFYPDGMRAASQFAKLEVVDAFTQWEDQDYADGSNVWHDSVLIASKPIDSEAFVIESQPLSERRLEILSDKGQTNLYRLQVQRTQQDLADMQTKVYQAEYYTRQAQSELDNTKIELDNTKIELDNTKIELQKNSQVVEEMKSSRFWMLRNAWFKVKNVNSDIGISSNLYWKDDLHLTINDVSFNLSCDTKELQTNTSSKDSFLLGKPRHLVEKAVAISHKEKIKKIFEMGILQGGSVVLYDQIFQPQVIAAIEYSAEPVNALTEYIAKYNKGSVVKPYYGVNQADRSDMGKILSSEFPRKDIDLIIDDASHFYKETKEAFNISFPYLRKGGLYIIEDWAWAHWSGDYWQNGQTPGLAGKDAMSNLLIELFMLAASRPDFISDILVEHSTITVRKGTGDLPMGDFDISEHYLLRGKEFGAWL